MASVESGGSSAYASQNARSQPVSPRKLSLTERIGTKLGISVTSSPEGSPSLKPSRSSRRRGGIYRSASVGDGDDANRMVVEQHLRDALVKVRKSGIDREAIRKREQRIVWLQGLTCVVALMGALPAIAEQEVAWHRWYTGVEGKSGLTPFSESAKSLCSLGILGLLFLICVQYVMYESMRMTRRQMDSLGKPFSRDISWTQWALYRIRGGAWHHKAVILEHKPYYIIMEILICSVHPFPGYHRLIDIQLLGTVATYRVESILLLAMLARFYLLVRFMRDREAIRLSRFRTLIEGQRFSINNRLILKLLVNRNPIRVVGSTAAIVFCVCAFATRQAEIGMVKPDNDEMIYSWNNIWLMVITMTTVGYGDVFPEGHLSRFVSTFAAVLGICLTSLLTAAISQQFDFTSVETFAVNEHEIRRRGHKLNECAALVIQRWWKYCIYPSTKTARLKTVAGRAFMSERQRKLRLENAQDSGVQTVLQSVQNRVEEGFKQLFTRVRTRRSSVLMSEGFLNKSTSLLDLTGIQSQTALARAKRQGGSHEIQSSGETASMPIELPLNAPPIVHTSALAEASAEVLSSPPQNRHPDSSGTFIKERQTAGEPARQAHHKDWLQFLVELKDLSDRLEFMEERVRNEFERRKHASQSVFLRCSEVFESELGKQCSALEGIIQQLDKATTAQEQSPLSAMAYTKAGSAHRQSSSRQFGVA